MAVNFGQDDEPTREELEKSIPPEFWELPTTFISDPGARRIYKEMYQRLLEENPDRDTAELLILERASALYAYMRELEATVGYRNTSDYRQLSALWTSIVQDLRKTRHANLTEEQVRLQVSQEYIEIINKAISGLEPDVANSVRRRVANLLES